MVAQVTDLNSALIRCDEGDKTIPYKDSDGIWTVGEGHNLVANGIPAGICSDAPDGVPYPQCMQFLTDRVGLRQSEIDLLFEHDLKANCSWLWSKPWWPAVDPVRAAALNDMAFNLGPVRAKKFTTFYGLVAVLDWQAAAEDLEFKTAVAVQLPKRYARLEQILRTGVMPAGIA